MSEAFPLSFSSPVHPPYCISIGGLDNVAPPLAQGENYLIERTSALNNLVRAQYHVIHIIIFR